jgi:hypothetical protein
MSQEGMGSARAGESVFPVHQEGAGGGVGLPRQKAMRQRAAYTMPRRKRVGLASGSTSIRRQPV